MLRNTRLSMLKGDERHAMQERTGLSLRSTNTREIIVGGDQRVHSHTSPPSLRLIPATLTCWLRLSNIRHASPNAGSDMKTGSSACPIP